MFFFFFFVGFCEMITGLLVFCGSEGVGFRFRFLFPFLFFSFSFSPCGFVVFFLLPTGWRVLATWAGFLGGETVEFCDDILTSFFFR